MSSREGRQWACLDLYSVQDRFDHVDDRGARDRSLITVEITTVRGSATRGPRRGTSGFTVTPLAGANSAQRQAESRTGTAFRPSHRRRGEL